MKKYLLLFFILFLFGAVGYFSAPQGARDLMGWSVAAVVFVVSTAVIGWVLLGSWLGWRAIQIKLLTMAHIAPNEHGDFGLLYDARSKVWVNPNMLPVGASPEQRQAHAVWRFTSGKFGTPPAAILGDGQIASSGPLIEGETPIEADYKILADPNESPVMMAIALEEVHNE